MPAIASPLTWHSAPRLFGGASAVAALLALAACGSTGETTSSPSASGGSAGGTPLTVTAQDFSFTPASFAVPAGATVSVTLQNQGKVEHSFTLDNGSGEVEADGGSSKTLSFTAPQSGTLAFHCKYHPTQMKGTITVGGSAGAGGSSSSSTSSSSSYGGVGY